MASILSRKSLMALAIAAGAALGGCATRPTDSFLPAENGQTASSTKWTFDVAGGTFKSGDGKYAFKVRSGTTGAAQPDGKILSMDSSTQDQIASAVYAGTSNDSAFEIVKGVGPLPAGDYYVRPHNGVSKLNRLVLDLVPMPGTPTFGRSAFELHAIKPGENGTDGCIGLDGEINSNKSADQAMELVVQLQQQGKLQSVHVASSRPELSAHMSRLWQAQHNIDALYAQNDPIKEAVAPAARRAEAHKPATPARNFFAFNR